jgi:hypothetical protein
MGSRKGIPNKVTDEQRAWAAKVDRMLAQASPDKKEGFDRLICRLLTTGAEQTKIALIRLMIPYRRGLPKQEIEASLTISYTEALQKMRAKRAE